MVYNCIWTAEPDADEPINKYEMATPGEKIAEALSRRKHLHDGGEVALHTSERANDQRNGRIGRFLLNAMLATGVSPGRWSRLKSRLFICGL